MPPSPTTLTTTPPSTMSTNHRNTPSKRDRLTIRSKPGVFHRLFYLSLFRRSGIRNRWILRIAPPPSFPAHRFEPSTMDPSNPQPRFRLDLLLHHHHFLLIVIVVVVVEERERREEGWGWTKRKSSIWLLRFMGKPLRSSRWSNA